MKKRLTKTTVSLALIAMAIAGIFATGMSFSPVSFEAGTESYSMQELAGWVKHGDYWYCYGIDGRMYRDKWVKSADGFSWYYLKSDGIMASDEFVTWNNNAYYMKPGGKMASNEWVKINNIWYYFRSNGSMMASSWLKWSDKWYYLKADGVMASNETMSINGKTYRFGSSGAMATGWLKLNNAWYYFKSDGNMAKSEWLQWGNNWYYLKSDGVMAADETLPIGNKGYRFNSNGAWVSTVNTTVSYTEEAVRERLQQAKELYPEGSNMTCHEFVVAVIDIVFPDAGDYIDGKIVTDLTKLRIGDIIHYTSNGNYTGHVAIITGISKTGSISKADGGYGGANGVYQVMWGNMGTINYIDEMTPLLQEDGSFIGAYKIYHYTLYP